LGSPKKPVGRRSRKRTVKNPVMWEKKKIGVEKRLKESSSPITRSLKKNKGGTKG